MYVFNIIGLRGNQQKEYELKLIADMNKKEIDSLVETFSLARIRRELCIKLDEIFNAGGSFTDTKINCITETFGRFFPEVVEEVYK